MKKKKIYGFLSWVIILILALIAVFPLYLVVINAFKAHTDIVRNPLSFPTETYLENFKKAWEIGNFGTGFVNSMKLVVTAVLITLAASSMAGYVLGTKKFKGDGLVKGYFLLAMTIPVQLFLFPLYSAFAKLHFIGNIYAVAFVIAAINMPLAVMLMRTFFISVPIQVEEAARLDGANTIQLLVQVIFPMVSPGFVTVAVIMVLNAWNEYLVSSTFLQGQENFTVTLGYLALNGGAVTFDQGMKMAGALLIIVPILIVFMALQKYVVDGLTSGAVKE